MGQVTKLTAPEVLDRLREQAGPFLLSAGQMGDFNAPKATRVLITTVAGSQLTQPQWCWVRVAELGALVRGLMDRGVRLGSNDGMYATGASRVWSPGCELNSPELAAAVTPPHSWPDPDGRHRFALFQDERLALWLMEDALVWAEGGLRLQPAEVDRVEYTLSSDWTDREVSVVTRSGSRHQVAHDVDQWPMIDPTYDGLMLMADTSWATDLTVSLAAEIGCRSVVPR